ncbi:MAG: hypothetical protein F7B06_06890 [Opitutae bacterium]|nr:hypothetical protein [Opitutae bacterium]
MLLVVFNYITSLCLPQPYISPPFIYTVFRRHSDDPNATKFTTEGERKWTTDYTDKHGF